MRWKETGISPLFFFDNSEYLAALCSWVSKIPAKFLKLDSRGVLAVSKEECETLDLLVTPDPATFQEYALIDFSAYGKSATEKKAKLLKAKAEARGWLN